MSELSNTIALSKKRLVSLLVNYFILYLYLLPLIFSWLTLILNPNATTVYVPFQYIAYAITLFISIWIALPLWKQGYHVFSTHKKKVFKIICLNTIFILLLNVALSFIVAIFTNTTTSENQSQIVNSSMLQPFLNFLITVIFAPIVEETVFRGGIFVSLRSKYTWLFAAVISSLCFGLLHVFHSFMNGNLIDVSYLLVYAGIGFILAYTYEKSNTLQACVLVHAISNGIAFIFLYI